MPLRPLPPPLSRLLLLAGLLAFLPAFAREAKWLPITDEDRAATRSEIDPDAGAEILYRNQTVKCETSDWSEYIRIKLYNGQGVQQLAKIDLPVPADKFKSVAARIIASDGKITVLRKEEFFHRDLLRRGDWAIPLVSFTFPRQEPGSIIEYQWEADNLNVKIYRVRLDLRRRWPTRHAVLQICPSQYLKTGVSFPPGLATTNPEDAAGNYTFVEHNLPALRNEPFPPPHREICPEIYFRFYPHDPAKMDLWLRFGRDEAESLDNELTITHAIRIRCSELVAPSGDARDKLTRLYHFCQTRIRNLRQHPPTGPADAAEILSRRHDTDDVLRLGCGYPRDINLLFLALARAAGLEARWVLCNNRSEEFFDPDAHDPAMLESELVAVRLGANWVCYDPGNPYLPFGQLSWENEGVQALAIDRKKSEWLTTPARSAADSCTRRTAKLRLDADGTLEGDVHLKYTGHRAVEARQELADLGPDKREERMRQRLQERLPTVELSALDVRDIDDPATSLQLGYHVRIPGYAECTGSRLFLQPAYFEKGLPALFTAEKREYDIYFHFPWSEEDDVTIALPAGFTPEQASSPKSFPAREGADIKYVVALGITRSGDSLRYKRSFACELQLVSKDLYATIRKNFDEIQRRDGHVIILRPVEPSTSSPRSPSTP